MSRRKIARRLAVREYAPLIGLILCWSIIAATARPADVARLLAVTVLVRSARFLAVADTVVGLKRRLAASAKIRRQAMRKAAAAEALALAAGFLVVAAIAALLNFAGDPKAAMLCLLVAVGLPVRYLMPFTWIYQRPGAFRPAVSWSGALLAAAAWAGGFGLTGIALALGLREWLAWAAATAPWKRRRLPVVEQPLTWREIATHTFIRGRSRLTYRISKGVLSALMGPVGGVAARTGRGMGLHIKLQRYTPQSFGAMLALFAIAAAAGVGLILTVPKPVTLVIGASLLRIAAGAGSVLFWWPFADRSQTDTGEEDEDD